MRAQYGAVRTYEVCRPVLVGTVFAPRNKLHFWAPRARSFLLISILPSSKHGTMAISTTELPQKSIDGPNGAERT